jgi:hypothetical protein
VEMSTSSETASRSGTKLTYQSVMQPEGSVPVHENPPLLPIASKITAIHTATFYLLKTHFSNILPTTYTSYLSCRSGRKSTRDHYENQNVDKKIRRWTVDKQKLKRLRGLSLVLELYRPSDRRLSAKLVPTCADRGCQVVSVTDFYGRNLGFVDRSRYFSFK